MSERARRSSCARSYAPIARRARRCRCCAACRSAPRAGRDRGARSGPSGAGKSTLLHVAGLLERPDGGEVLLDGRDCGAMSDLERTRLRRSGLGFVYQFHHLLPEFSALENVMLPQMIAGVARKPVRAHRALALLRQVGLGPRAEHRPARLSGGEQQRVAIVRALANRRTCCWATSPPAISISTPPARSWRSSGTGAPEQVRRAYRNAQSRSRPPHGPHPRARGRPPQTNRLACISHGLAVRTLIIRAPGAEPWRSPTGTAPGPSRSKRQGSTDRLAARFR